LPTNRPQQIRCTRRQNSFKCNASGKGSRLSGPGASSAALKELGSSRPLANGIREGPNEIHQFPPSFIFASSPTGWACRHLALVAPRALTLWGPGVYLSASSRARRRSGERRPDGPAAVLFRRASCRVHPAVRIKSRAALVGMRVGSRPFLPPLPAIFGGHPEILPNFASEVLRASGWGCRSTGDGRAQDLCTLSAGEPALGTGTISGQDPRCSPSA
jgi:hypothetical protein